MSTFLSPLVPASRGAILLLACYLLAACQASNPSWVPASLQADASRDTSGAGFRPYDEVLDVAAGANAELKFSLAPLPNGPIAKLVVDSANSSTNLQTENYTLDASKVFRARLALYVESVSAPGYLAIAGAYTAGGDCYPNEAVASACTSTIAGPVRAGDADNPATALRITEPGWYSFDVTDVIRHRITNGYDGILRVSAAADPGNGSRGQFAFASKERTLVARFAFSRQPQLLITLVDAGATVSYTVTTTSVQTSTSNPSIADRNFALDDDMLVNGDPDQRAYALVQPTGAPTMGATVRSFVNTMGTRAYKMTMSTHANSAFPSHPSTPNPQLSWYRTPAFSTLNPPITWNTGWSVPPQSALVATHPLRSDRASQTVLTDISADYLSVVQQAYVADASNVRYALAATTNVLGPITIDGKRNAAAGHAPQVTTVLVPRPPTNFIAFDPDDTTHVLRYCIGANEGCPNTQSFRARIGQPFNPDSIVVDVRATFNSADIEYTTPITVSMPTSGASAELQTDPHPSTQALAAGFGGLGYVLALGHANHVVGTYRGIISMPGHNLRATLQFQNLPLPSPALTGPARVLLPAGQASVTVPVDATVPFVLDVDDAVVNQNIDETTHWRFTSSNAADTMPGDVYRTDGTVAVPMTFGSPGPRTITVTSLGDSTITDTFDVIVDGGSTTTLAAQGPIAVFGQPITLSANVTDYAGAPVMTGSVEFRSGSVVLGSAPVVLGNASITVSTLAVGLHLVSAHYSGDQTLLVGASESAEQGFAVDRAGVSLAVSAAPTSLVGDPVSVAVAVTAAAPGAGTPGGTVTVTDGSASCQIVLAAASACTLTPPAAGSRTFVVAYSGDAGFLENLSTVVHAVFERAVLSTTVADGSDYARYGRMVDYAITVVNSGLGAADQVPIDVTLSAAFDGAFASWQCFGGGGGATCAASGSGPLHDVATIPPGRSLTWFVRAPVLAETAETEAILGFDVGGHAPQHGVDTNMLVLWRDGFDDAYATAVLGDATAADLFVGGVHAFALPPAGSAQQQTVLALRDGTGSIRVQRTWQDATTSLVRLSSVAADGHERVTPWARTTGGELVLSGLRDEVTATTTLLLEGTDVPVAMTYAADR